MECGSKSGNNGESCCGTSSDNDREVRILAEMKAKLTPLEYRVTQDKVTERPFSNRYNRHWESGTYHCVVCNTELFKSDTKFESKSGWPAFHSVVDEKRIQLKADTSHVGANILLLISRPDIARNEVSCSFCRAHLGHLFKDGPKPTGLRYCINSNSLSFQPNCATDSVETEIIGDDDAVPTNNNTSGSGKPVEESQSKPIVVTVDENSKGTSGPVTVTAQAPTPTEKDSAPKPSIKSGNIAPSRNPFVAYRDSTSASTSPPPNKGKLCIFAQCLPSSDSVSPETSPTTPKHYYAPKTTAAAAAPAASTVINNGKIAKLNKSNIKPAVVVAEVVPKPPEYVKHIEPVLTLTRRFGTNVPASSEHENIEIISRRPSNGVLRETSL